MAENKPNQAAAARSRLIAALQSQQSEIKSQASEIRMLKSAVREIITVAGVQGHPKFAALMKSAENNETPATTTEQARQPQATDDVENEGAAPAAANEDVTPDAVTDVQTTDVVGNPAPLDNLQYVTAPVAGTDAVDPAATFEGEVSVGTGSNSGSGTDPNGWTTAPASTGRSASLSPEQKQERFIASTRLARLRIQAGLAATAQGDDLTVAQEIYDSEESLEAIKASINTLSAVASRTATAQRTDAHRGLVPQRSASRAVPSLAQPPMTATASAADTDEWGFGYSD